MLGTPPGRPCHAFCSRARLLSLGRPRPIPSQSRPSKVLSVEIGAITLQINKKAAKLSARLAIHGGAASSHRLTQPHA